VRVPKLFDIIRTTDEKFWSENLIKFPSEYRSRGDIVQMERILPLPKVIRKALVAHFYSHNSNAPLDSVTLSSILDDTPNKHCLARIYLGRENGVFTREGFSLRNFPLYLKPMQELGLDVLGLASAMGKAFAIMHWGAGVNGDDVEIVLGSSTVGGEEDEGSISSTEISESTCSILVSATSSTFRMIRMRYTRHSRAPWSPAITNSSFRTMRRVVSSMQHSRRGIWVRRRLS